ncbi:chemotaxis protein MotB [Parafilimonas terrae]|uniref:Chemotaxis protein MotB n=2 Tax=Parafilimonas terrae TaxID=1465490 RepID=A0A1I5TLS0_9BACT|nr:chemotaxis protein MotB [Parafilimonas terrae]
MISATAMAILATSCVGTKKYQALQADYSSLQGRMNAIGQENADCQSNLSSANVKIAGLQDQLRAERANAQNLQASAQSLQAALDKCLTSTSQGNVNISKLVDEINSSNKYIQQLVNSKNKSDSLNMVLTNNLTRSLSREEMKDVDVQVLKGVVYISLSDNMLYKSGSYEISDKANETLSKIAKIIMDYKDFEVLIEGNTDNVPISKPNIRNNWDLSALRASSVVQALQNTFGVDPKRLTAGGRGEYNPIASNDTPDGKAKNRRTQIIITPKLDQFMELIDKAPEPDSTVTPPATTN